MAADMNHKRVVLLDGGMGRELWYRGADVPKGLWSAQALFDAPDVVREIHRDYILAGADVITTNTYGVARENFESLGLGDRFGEMLELACQLAIEGREEAGASARIAGSLPPLEESYRPDLVRPFAEMLPRYQEMVGHMAPLVDFFLCETMSNIDESLAAATAAAESGKPVWVAWTLNDYAPDRLKSGETIAQANESLAHLPIEGLLANCCMPETIAGAMPDLVNTNKSYIGGYANTFNTPPPDWTLESEGLLGLREDLDPEPYAALVQQWLDGGATVVGGCCGTRPAHIALLRSLIEGC
ncbi:MAG: homocysteine S-methyltransferase family protein [Thermomicrobiales bacterium]|nr:homocysteine S-methyltransferase family protein [Thermomicrobiales bacterium]